MRVLFLVLFLLLPQTIFASSFSTKRSGGPFVGFGFGYSGLHVRPSSGAASDFSGWNGLAEAGYVFEFNNGGGISLGGEYKITEADNTREDSTYMEKAKVSAMTGKLGLIFNGFTIGGGYSETTLRVKNVSMGSTGETTKFKGNPIMYFVNYAFESGPLRTIIEAQYNGGDLKDIEYQDYSLSLRLHFLLGN